MRDHVDLIVHLMAVDEHLREAINQVAKVAHTLEVSAFRDVKESDLGVLRDRLLTAKMIALSNVVMVVHT